MPEQHPRGYPGTTANWRWRVATWSAWWRHAERPGEWPRWKWVVFCGVMPLLLPLLGVLAFLVVVVGWITW